MRTVLLSLLLASPLAQDNPISAASRFACGPGNVEFNVTKDKSQHAQAQPEPGKALVYVVSVKSYPIIRVGLDGAWVGAVNDISYVSFPVAPGEHHLCANWQGRTKDDPTMFAFRSFTAESGRIYYFRTTITGYETGKLWVMLDSFNDDEGRFMAAASALSIAHPKK